MNARPTTGPLASATATALALAVLTGCPSPDVEGKHDRFLDDTEDEREEAQNVKMDVGGTLADVTGTFLFALDTVVQPGTPLQFIATTTFTPDGAGGTIGFDLQPLSLEQGSVTTPREPVGDLINVEPVPVDEGGSFEIGSLGTLMVTGMANPITGSDIVAEVSLTGNILSEDIYCGQAAGMVTEPLPLELAGSTFAALRIDATDPASLPDENTILLRCPEGGVGEDDGGGSDDGGSDDGGSTG